MDSRRENHPAARSSVSSGEAVVRLRGVGKSYRGAWALEPLDLDLHRGEIYGLIGENGAGKSTLISLMTGISRPSCGSIEIFGASTGKDLAAARRRMGFMPDASSAYPMLSARGNMEVRCAEWGVSSDVIDELLDLVGLGAVGRKKARSFSLGMKRRLDCAIALLGAPEFIVFDEPINGLDPAGIVEMRELIKRINRERGTTMLVSSHILSELSEVATRYIVLSAGRLIDCLAADDMLDRPGGVEGYFATIPSLRAPGHRSGRDCDVLSARRAFEAGEGIAVHPDSAGDVADCCTARHGAAASKAEARWTIGGRR
ncbi:MAG: ATP-binding cassette domain-containing protein [Slackia sp.]|nr:ATP-binding cassette domain-containing protein [Slackia sp.]